MKNYTIFKEDLQNFIIDINKAMTKNKTFYNVKTKEHKDNKKIIVIIG